MSVENLKESVFKQKRQSEVEEQQYDKTIRCVLFNLDSEVYGVPVKKVKEVLRVGSIREVHGSSFEVLGIINVRGVIVTVVDIRKILNLDCKEIDGYSRIVIVELDEEHLIGMLVDNVKEVKDIPESRFEALKNPNDINNRLINGIAHLHDEVIILLDVDEIFLKS